MIFIARTPEPAILVAHKAAWLVGLQAAKAASAVSGDKSEFKRWQKKYGHRTVKKDLEAMCHSKCSYCESPIAVVTYGDIEHFRPKSRFIGLTYSWDNLLLSCSKCNNKQHKGERFPSVAAGGRLIDPSLDDPSAHMEFVYDVVTKQALAKSKSRRGETTIKLFGLNSRKPLVKARSSLIKKLILLKTYEHLDPEAAALLAEAKLADEPYLAWVRAIV